MSQLFLAWPQLFPIMMATWQVWGPLLLLQVIKSIVILLLHFPSVKLFSDLALDVYKTSIDTLSWFSYWRSHKIKANLFPQSRMTSQHLLSSEEASVSNERGPGTGRFHPERVHGRDGEEHHAGPALHCHRLDDRCFLQLRHWEVLVKAEIKNDYFDQIYRFPPWTLPWPTLPICWCALERLFTGRLRYKVFFKA